MDAKQIYILPLLILYVAVFRLLDADNLLRRRITRVSSKYTIPVHLRE